MIANTYAIDMRFLDSIETILKNSKDNKEKLNSLYTLTFEYGLFNPTKGMEYGRKLLYRAKIENDSNYIFQAYNGLANCYDSRMMYDSSLYYNELCYSMVEHSSKYRQLYASLCNMSLCHKQLGHYNLALQYLEKAAKCIEGKMEHNPRFYYYLCDLYLRVNNAEKAKATIKQGIKNCEQRKGDYLYFQNILYGYLGSCYVQLSKPDSAFYFLTQSVEGLKAETDTIALANAFEFMADAQQQFARHDSAIYYYNKAIVLYERLNNAPLRDFTSIKLIYALSFKKEFSKAQLQKQLLNKAENSIKYNTNYDLLLDTYFWLNKTYERLGDYKSALLYSKKTDSITQQILDNEKRLMFLDFEKSFEMLERERKIQALKNINKINRLELENKNAAIKQYLLLISLIAIIFISITFSIIQYNKKKRAVLSALHQLNLQETKLNERVRISKDIHDEIGAGLSKISLTTELSKKKLAGDVETSKTIETIGAISKQLIDNMRDLIWMLKPDNAKLNQLAIHLREYVSDYLENLPITLLLNFPETVSSEIKISKDFQHHILLTFKEAINNCVKHSGANTLSIDLKIENAQLMILIKDNGKGFESTINTGNGLNNMQQRIQAIGGSLKLESIKNSGTSIEIKCPIA